MIYHHETALGTVALDTAALPPAITLELTAKTWRPEWTMTCPVLSTGHITAEDAERLDRESDAGDGGISTLSAGMGWLIQISVDYIPTDYADYSPHFRHLLTFLAAAGYTWLRLDTDGETLPHLPTFDW